MENIRIGIVGYGNLGKGVEMELAKNTDMSLEAIFTRRDVNEIKPYTNTKVISFSEIENYVGKIDVLILCGGSAKDLDYQSVFLSKNFNIVDSFDTHAKINTHFNEVDEKAKEGNKTAIVSVGWDPGLFSMTRALSEAILVKGNTYTFWGKGVSQGHSDAIRQIEGVKDAIQYTVPNEEAIDRVRNFENPNLTVREKHTRECYVLVKEGYEKSEIEKAIKEMPYYFDEYDTVVNFVDEEEMKKHKEKLPHGGFVLRSGNNGENNKNNSIVEFSLKLDSNPEFTSGVLIAYARAACRLNKENNIGAKTVLDVPISYLLRVNERSELNKYL